MAEATEKTAEANDIAVLRTEHQYPAVEAGKGETAGIEGAHSKKVHNAELFAATQESKIPRWSKESRWLYFAIFISFCCACTNGYDGSLLSGLLAMDPFQAKFHSGTAGEQVSVISSLYSVGSIVGPPLASITSDKLGRRFGMTVGAIIIIVGMIIAATSETIPQLVVGRFVLGFGVSFMTVAAPAGTLTAPEYYSIEVAPPHWRGRCTGIYNCGWFGGAIPAAAVTFGCGFITNDWAWRIPIILQAFTCFIVLGAVWFIPESPRYLMANGKEEEAIAFLVKYHGNNNPNSRLVLLEVEEMRENIKQDGSDKRNFDYRGFLTHNGRWRLAQVAMIGIFGQFAGNGLGYFNANIFTNMGVTTSAGLLGYNLLNQCLSAVGALTAVAYTDRMPRRKVLVYGSAVCTVLLAINGGLNSALANQGDNLDPSYEKAALATYFIFNVVVSFTYTPLQGVIPAEALDTNMRAKGLALYGMMVSAVGFINQFAIPISLANIQNRTIYIFVAADFLETIGWWLWAVESQGRTLEQLEWVYNQPHPVRASLKVDEVIVQADGHVSEKIVRPEA